MIVPYALHAFCLKLFSDKWRSQSCVFYMTNKYYTRRNMDSCTIYIVWLSQKSFLEDWISVMLSVALLYHSSLKKICIPSSWLSSMLLSTCLSASILLYHFFTLISGLVLITSYMHPHYLALRKAFIVYLKEDQATVSSHSSSSQFDHLKLF